jgi:hypothetical protein
VVAKRSVLTHTAAGFQQQGFVASSEHVDTVCIPDEVAALDGYCVFGYERTASSRCGFWADGMLNERCVANGR